MHYVTLYSDVLFSVV